MIVCVGVCRVRVCVMSEREMYWLFALSSRTHARTHTSNALSHHTHHTQTCESSEPTIASPGREQDTEHTTTTTTLLHNREQSRAEGW